VGVGAAGRAVGAAGGVSGIAAAAAIGITGVGGCAASIVGRGVIRGSAAAVASIGPVPASNHGSDISGKAPIIFCTTSKLGLLRSLRIWLMTGRPTPMRSAN
jgi:hypothetical protein